MKYIKEMKAGIADKEIEQYKREKVNRKIFTYLYVSAYYR